jgi:putative tryptophan/tyrosine transport system substrate-binding protein
MRRREFIAGLGSAAAWPVVARAQQSAVPVIGFLNIASPETWDAYVNGFKQGLAQIGFVEGVNVAIEYRWARGQYDRLSALAADLANRKPAVIAANGGSRVALAAKSATSTIPIVFTFGDGDPVQHGLVESMNRPGGNVTGITMVAGLLESKRLELIREIVPTATTVHMLVNPNNAGFEQDVPTIEASARGVGLRFQTIAARTEAEIDIAFGLLAQQDARALMVENDAFFTLRAGQIATLAIRYAVPAIFPWREQALAGGLLSYGASIREAYRQSGLYVGQILRGAKPADLPVQQPTKFELVINRTTAKAIGVDFPLSLLIQADEVIE